MRSIGLKLGTKPMPREDEQDTDLESGEGEDDNQNPKTFTQDEVNAISAKERRKAEERAQKKIDLEVQRRLLEKTTKTTKQAPKEPVIDDFDTVEEYNQAKINFEVKKQVKKALAEKDEEAETEEQEEERLAVERNWAKHEKLAEKAHPDFHEALESAEDIKIPPYQQEAVMSSNHAGEMAYYLAKNPEELTRITKLKPKAALLALGRIEAKFEAKPKDDDDKDDKDDKDSTENKDKSSESKKTPLSKPIKPLGKTTKSDSAVIKEDDDMETFIHKRNIQLGRTK